MATANELAQVQQLYSEYLGREADPTGMDYWAGLLGSGQQPIEAIRSAFAASPEAAAYAQAEAADRATNEAYISGLYQGGLDREADVAGLDYWTDQLTSGNISRENLANEFAQAADIGEDAYRDLSLARIGDLYNVTPDIAQALYDVWPTTTQAIINNVQTDTGLLTDNAISSEDVLAELNSGAGGLLGGYNAVPFGSTVVGNRVIGTGYENAAPYSPELTGDVEDVFQQSMAYQSTLPNMIPQFDVNAINPIYTQQFGQAYNPNFPANRLDISGVQVPAWLRVNTPEEAKKLAQQEATAKEAATSGTKGWQDQIDALTQQNADLQAQIEASNAQYND
jgi:hypothetical protein